MQLVLHCLGIFPAWRINLLLSQRPKSQQRSPGFSSPSCGPSGLRCRGRSRCVIPSSETGTHKCLNARGWGATSLGQEENICGSEGTRGPSPSVPPPRDSGFPRPRFSSRSSRVSSPRMLRRPKAGKGMLRAQWRCPLLVLLRNFARGGGGVSRGGGRARG